MGSNRAWRLLDHSPLFLILTFALSSCQSPVALPSEAQNALDRIELDWNALLVVLQGGRSPVARKKGARVEPSGRPSAGGFDAAVSARNAELLQEMFKVIYVRDFQNPREFADYVDTLNQGASIEGLYNGFTRSSVYRKLEMANNPVPPQALRAFSEELARLESTLPETDRTAFDSRAALPLALPVAIGGSLTGAVDTPRNLGELEGGAGELVFGKDPHAAASPTSRPTPLQSSVPLSLEDLASQYRDRFRVSSIFTLKRILGEEALKVITAKVSDPSALAKWYGKWVTELCARKVDFGLDLRNRPDAAFHEAWARSSSEDRLRWEVLNRLHRVLNEAARKE